MSKSTTVSNKGSFHEGASRRRPTACMHERPHTHTQPHAKAAASQPGEIRRAGTNRGRAHMDSDAAESTQYTIRFAIISAPRPRLAALPVFQEQHKARRSLMKQAGKVGVSNLPSGFDSCERVQRSACDHQHCPPLACLLHK